jgi:hypothetical protein
MTIRNVPTVVNPDVATLAYLAGFFDGEGCVYIVKGKNGEKVQYSMEMSYTNSEIEPLQLAQSVFGGQISSLNEVRAGRKQVHRLRIRSNQAATALSLIYPYLLVKRERVGIALEFQEKMRGSRGAGRNLSIEACERYKAAITALNDKVWNQGITS